MFVVSAAIQFYTQRDEPDFPPCPRTQQQRDRALYVLAEESADGSDRAGLLSRVSYPSYRSTDAQVGFDNPNYEGYGVSRPANPGNEID